MMRMPGLRWLIAGLFAALLPAAAVALAPAKVAAWPDWQAFDEAFVDAQGRVIDWADHGRTVSEAQAYSLFFALVANDQRRFAQIYGWTERNLAQGDLRKNRPAWLWGERDDGSWGVLDANAATDADLWLAYTLIEAGRLWRKPDYGVTGHALLAQLAGSAVALVPGGPTLMLPGQQGFTDNDGSIRINPSYYVPMQLIGLQNEDPKGPWLRLLRDYLALLPQIAPLGRVPDWTVWRGDRVVVDPATAGVGGYDAIRVYLWAGMVPFADHDSQALHGALHGYRDMIHELGHVPEHWSTGNSGISGDAPPGFYAALLPFLQHSSDPATYEQLRQHLDASRADGLYGKPARYYDQVLVLFGKGFVDGHYRFDAKGRVIPSWQ